MTATQTEPDVTDSDGAWTGAGHPDQAPGESDADYAARASGGKRERSTIKFPYTDIRDATVVAQTLKNQFGSSATLDQVAGALGQKVTSGAFRNKVNAAQLFGAVHTKRGTVALTPLGHALADQRTQPGALVRAFMTVPLYLKLYEKYQGQSLPEGPGLEAEIGSLGVVESQTDRARQAFMRSAEHAGLFWAGRDRLVIPGNASLEADKGTGETPPSGHDSSDVKEENLAESQLLLGLWERLPADGDFGADERRRWLRALVVNLDLVYGDTDLVVNVDVPAHGAPRTHGFSGEGTLSAQGVGNG